MISELAGTGEVSVDIQNDAADYAFRLFDRVMRDDGRDMETRLDCARDVLNRVWGKPKQAVEVGTKGDKPLAIQIVEVVRPAPKPVD